jgi:D-beta-D-heptose 7-phosphate kinase/D-beta-D-heptose 1-phosphate adenosyltransferase
MTDRLPDLIDGFGGRRVPVIGDAMLDGYLEGACGRVCPEAPVPVVDVCRSHAAPGGAANAAANARAFGADVTLLGVVGDDAEATELAALLGDNGVSPDSLVARPGRRTLAKRRVRAAGQVVCRLDQGDTGPADAAGEAELVHRLTAGWAAADAVVVSDYGYGAPTPAVVAALAALQHCGPRVVVADSKRLHALRPVGPTAVKPNFAEASRLLGLDHNPCRPRAAVVAPHGPRILEQTGVKVAAVTLDTEGTVVFERDRPAYRTYAELHPHSRASGAGDTYTAALALVLAPGADTPATAELAAAAAAVVVGKDGTARCTARELRARVAGEQKVTDREGAIVRVAEERRSGGAAARSPGRAHQRLLRHPAPRPRHLPHPREGPRRPARGRGEHRRRHPPAQGAGPPGQLARRPGAGARRA